MSDDKLQDYVEKAKKMLDKHGWMIQVVLGDSDPGFAYTVGFSKTLERPEVFMVGFAPDLMQALLNDLGQMIREGTEIKSPGFLDGLIRDYPVAFRPVEPLSVEENSNAGQAILGHSFEAYQMFLPDPNGLFPWDPGCDPKYVKVQTKLLRTVGEPPIQPPRMTH